MRFELIRAEKANYPVVVLCSALDVSCSGFYAWCKRPVPARAKDDAQLAVEIAASHARSRGTYGSPRVGCGPRADHGVACHAALTSRV